MRDNLRRNKKAGLDGVSHLSRGFSLIELLVVVAIILIIASIAIPSYLHVRIVANEAAAASNIRAITTAATVYSTTWNDGYPGALSILGGTALAATCNQAGLLDPLLTTPPYRKSGYTFIYSGQAATTVPPPGCGAPGFYGYLAVAVPNALAFTGTRSFCSTLPGVIHYDTTGAAIASVPACDALPVL